jgi:hypothetical protein
MTTSSLLPRRRSRTVGRSLGNSSFVLAVALLACTGTEGSHSPEPPSNDATFDTTIPHDASDADIDTDTDLAFDADGSASGPDDGDELDAPPLDIHDEDAGDAHVAPPPDAIGDALGDPTDPLDDTLAGDGSDGGTDGEEHDITLPPDAEPPPLPAWAGHPVRFEEIVVPGLEGVRFHPDPTEIYGYGAGAAAFDFDGDGRIDLFFGADGQGVHSACVYHNQSVPGAPRFERVASLCDGHLGRALTGIARPRRDGTGDNLLVLGENLAAELVFDPEGAHTVVPIYTAGDFDDTPDDQCFAMAAVWYDLDLDGEPEALIACGAHDGSDLSLPALRADNRVLVHDAEGWRRATSAEAGSLENPGSTLAWGVVDMENNGLPDLFVINDAFSTRNRRRTDLPEGELLLRAPPGALRPWQSVPFAADASAFGAFMGVAELRIGAQRRWYITDWGWNRLLGWAGGAFFDEAERRNADLARFAGFLLYAWSAIVDDYNADGLDDLLVTNGPVPLETTAVEDLAHRDILLQQAPDGTFTTLHAAVGLVPPSRDRSTLPGLVNSSRAGLKLDLDLDGRLEVVVLDHRGAVRVLREVVPVERPPRCNVDPRSHLTSTVGTGFAFRSTYYPLDRTWDVQGHLRFGAPSRLLLPEREGILRFPSGAEVPYACSGERNVVMVDEPDWIGIESVDGTDLLRASGPWLASGPTERVRVDITYLGPRSTELARLGREAEVSADVEAAVLAAGWPLDPPAGAERVLVAFDGRWVPRTFAITAPVAP